MKMTNKAAGFFAAGALALTFAGCASNGPRPHTLADACVLKEVTEQSMEAANNYAKSFLVKRQDLQKIKETCQGKSEFDVYLHPRPIIMGLE